ncbi:hypothetical protein [Chelativorans sp. AA-79]|uniref:hypothetical protein n=1 Tax=Chelativorans sp. AA-79 TaxID=3028735 RepID=UPI0023F94061|nr:hypothetical protein [Chelativorans sp. AA-79]WEX10472.1 hypothetical protein PVE73_05815 [Chelativorans sp. AA-79]
MATDFRTRNPNYDRHADWQRMTRLMRILDEVETGLVAERRGLEGRRLRAMEIASSSPSGEPRDGEDPRSACNGRLEDLQRQILLVARLREMIRSLADHT